MEIACAECGNAFEAKRDTARFCSTTCRVRAHRKKGPKIPKAVKDAVAERTHTVEGVVITDTPGAEQGPAPETVYAATRVALADAGQLHTVRGQSALVLAQRLDMPAMDTGSAVAALVKQLEATLESALAGQVEEVDELEELRRRREERLRTG